MYSVRFHGCLGAPRVPKNVGLLQRMLRAAVHGLKMRRAFPDYDEVAAPYLTDPMDCDLDDRGGGYWRGFSRAISKPQGPLEHFSQAHQVHHRADYREHAGCGDRRTQR